MTILRRFAALAILFVAPAAVAQQGLYELFLDTAELEAVPLADADPRFPGTGFRTGQEGWVRLNFVVTPAGTTTDTIVVDSVGGPAFEEAAREAVERWAFEPGDVEKPNNYVEMRFELQRGREAATSNFLRRYRRIMTHILEGETEYARNQVDAAVRLGGWNLYEEAMLNLMVGRLEGLEGKPANKLHHYLRSVGVATRAALDGNDRREALFRIVEIQHFYGQYGSALRSLARLEAEPRGDRDVRDLAEVVEEIETALASSAPLTAKGTLYTPCNCDEGQPLWYFQPVRSEFSFANVDGNVESFEARCEASRLSGDVEAGGRWTLPEDPSRCEIFVFGADGASFEILEHVTDETTARHNRSDVLDSTNGS